MLDTTSSLEPRLQRRDKQLVKEHLSITQPLAAGLRALPAKASAFASTQAAWRFYANPTVTLASLAEPLIDSPRAVVYNHSLAYALCLHDWSDLNYHRHTRKANRVVMGAARQLGFPLQTALLISDTDGTPIAPVCQSLWAADGIHTTRSPQVEPDAPQIDELTRSMNYLDELGFAKPLVHLIDRGADSVGHYRAWQASGQRFIVRADDKQRVVHHGRDLLLRDVVACLEFRASGAVAVKGVAGMQFVAETEITITRPARPHRQNQGVIEPRQVVKGEPIRLRLVVSQIRAADETLLSPWGLYSNLESQVQAETMRCGITGAGRSSAILSCSRALDIRSSIGSKRVPKPSPSDC